ncbi:hypothetical protein [Allobaculum sp. JKK-2023]|nr:hypothetical protein [Allobaculum sp. JKK-2023]
MNFYECKFAATDPGFDPERSFWGLAACFYGLLLWPAIFVG